MAGLQLLKRGLAADGFSGASGLRGRLGGQQQSVYLPVPVGLLLLLPRQGVDGHGDSGHGDKAVPPALLDLGHGSAGEPGSGPGAFLPVNV